ncbi:AI-2E family transporter [Mycoplasma sp. P36-A1]|uniref:AI-2E family transporter n=1 Tax=Mycoplasma sp. P36-A1 TaxID=3252900 RepID=UPI003C306D7C
MGKKKYQYLGFAFIVILMYTAVTNFSSFSGSLGKVFSIIKPIVYGMGIAYFIYPIVKIMYEKLLYPLDNKRIKKLGYYISILISYLLLFMIFYMLYSWLAPIVIESGNKIANLDYSKITSDTVEEWKQLQSQYSLLANIDATNLINTSISKISNLLSVDNVTKYITGVVGFTTSIYAVVMGIIISIYMILSKEELFAASNKFFEAVMSVRQFKYSKKYFLHFESTFKKFFFGKMLDSLIIGILAFIGLSLLKVPLFPLLAIVVMITNMIPYFGPFIGGIPVVLVTLFVTGDPMQALWSALFILALQQFDGIYLGPKILGDSVGVSSVWVIIAIVIGGATFGVLGLLLCVPMAASLKEGFNEFYDYRMSQRDSQIIDN